LTILSIHRLEWHSNLHVMVANNGSEHGIHAIVSYYLEYG